jgi:hypothetical protein
VKSVRSPILVASLALYGALSAAGSAVAADAKTTDKQALAALQPYIGVWRGVGQVQRGSNRGAWREQADWAWKFEREHASVVFHVHDGKYFADGKIHPGEAGMLDLDLTEPAGQTQVQYRGSKGADGALVFVALKPGGNGPARVTMRQVADGDRLVVLLERRVTEDRFSRLAEIGYTRQGSTFAKGSTQPECVVTGGAGTIPVEYQGRTYYVCCTGCKELFNDDPAGVLAEYRARKASGK